MKNSNLPKDLPKWQVKQNIEDQQLRDDFKRTFSSAHGKRVYKYLLERCHIFQTTFTGTSKTFFLEGERNIGLFLLAMMQLADNEGIEVIKEMDNEY